MDEQQQELLDAGIHQAAMSEIQNIWRLPQKHIAQVKQNYDISNSRHGLFANVPIICKGEACPYLSTCTVSILDLPTGHRCPMEIGAIMARFERYCEEFEVTEKNSVDLGQIKQLVDIEIMIMRCDSKIAKSSDFIEESLKDVTKNGVYIYEKVVTQENQFKMTLLERHARILKDLAATRSSKKDKGVADDASQVASLIMKRVKEVSQQVGVSSQDVLEADYYDDPNYDGVVIDEDDYESYADVVEEGEEDGAI